MKWTPTKSVRREGRRVLKMLGKCKECKNVLVETLGVCIDRNLACMTHLLHLNYPVEVKGMKSRSRLRGIK